MTLVDSGTVLRSLDAPDALSIGSALRLGVVSGLLTHLPWLALSRVEALRPLAVAMQAAFLLGDPWLTLPLIRRLGRLSAAGSGDLRFALVAGGIAGSVAAATTIAWERARTATWLPAGELAGQLVELALAVVFALSVVPLARRMRRSRGGAA